MSAGEAIVKRVRDHGVETIFGIPGAQIYPLFDGMDRFGIRLVLPRHEQAAAYMAMGSAKSTGRLAVCCVVPGPGVLNASAALCTAMGNCSPLLCLTGEVPSEYQGRGRGHLHELKDQAATLRSIIKNAFQINDSKNINDIVDTAVSTASSGRPGPVAVQMPWDKLAEPAAATTASLVPPTPAPTIDDEAVRRAAKLIARARRPMIMCGAGAQGATEAVTALAELLSAPVTAFRSGRGVVAEDHPLSAPPVAARELWEDVDLLIGVGSRLEMPYMRWRSGMHYEAHPAGPKLVRIDIDPAEMTRLVPDVGIVGDAALGCRALVNELTTLIGKVEDAGRRAQILAANRLARRLVEKVQPQTAYLDELRACLPRNAFIVPELSQVGFTTYTGALPIYEPRTYVTEGHQGTLGFGFPTSLGVKVANPDRAVVAICGDGGFMFGLQELATAAEFEIAVIAVVFNNQSYANVLRDQERGSGRVLGSKFKNPDFLRLADAFNVQGYRVSGPREFGEALRKALALDAPALIEVLVDPGSEVSPWPLIHMNRRPSQILADTAVFDATKSA